MAQVLEIIVAVLAVYGGYTALHELAALLQKWAFKDKSCVETEGSVRRSERIRKRKERRSHRFGGDH